MNTRKFVFKKNKGVPSFPDHSMHHDMCLFLTEGTKPT